MPITLVFCFRMEEIFCAKQCQDKCCICARSVLCDCVRVVCSLFHGFVLLVIRRVPELIIAQSQLSAPNL